ncbi:aldo/keto reductase [Streptomyces spiralis]|uniref:aldo/keto reductase n=1 Tax=Streptomyces spiralis TaxID=66376 RepID=UPI003F4D3977
MAVSGAYRALAELRRRGTIGAVSIGVNHAPVAARYLEELEGPGPDCVMLAGRYNLLDQSGLDAVLPLCESRGVAVMVAGVYQSGLLADPRPGAPHGYARVPDELARRVAAWHAICRRFTVPPAAAVQFPFGHPAVTSVVVSARTPEEVDATARMLAYASPRRLAGPASGQSVSTPVRSSSWEAGSVWEGMGRWRYRPSRVFSRPSSHRRYGSQGPVSQRERRTPGQAGC